MSPATQLMTIYNLFPLLVGRFGEWEPHLRRAADLGFNWVFVNSLQYPGFSGSLYSISDHFRWNPLFLDAEMPGDPFLQSREAIELGQGLGLRMMTDLVINHCAFDSPLLEEHPEWFEWNGSEVVHPCCVQNGKKIEWGDLAKFRYGDQADEEGLIRFWLRVIGFLVGQGFTGFRCDAAYQVPAKVWSRLIEEAKTTHPELVFVAESLGCTLEETLELAHAGFDYVFNSSKWWDFSAPWLMDQYEASHALGNSIAFPESHDTARLADELNGNETGMKQRYLFAALFSAGVLMPVGFEYGFRKRLHVVKTRPSDWEEPGMDLCDFIRSVNHLKHSQATFETDVPTEVIATNNPNILVMRKSARANQGKSLLILNKDPLNHQPFWCDSLYRLLPGCRRMLDVSPEFRLDYLPTPFEYALRPGQGIVLAGE